MFSRRVRAQLLGALVQSVVSLPLLFALTNQVDFEAHWERWMAGFFVVMLVGGWIRDKAVRVFSIRSQRTSLVTQVRNIAAAREQRSKDSEREVKGTRPSVIH